MSIKRFNFAFLLTFSFCIVLLVRSFCIEFLGERLLYVPFTLNDFLKPYFRPEKKIEVVAYILSILGTFGFLLIHYFFRSRVGKNLSYVYLAIKSYVNDKVRSEFLFYLANLLFVLIFYIFISHSQETGIVLMSTLLTSFYLFLVLGRFFFAKRRWLSRLSHLALLGVFFLLIGSLAFEDVPFINEFFSLPSQIKMGERIVDTKTFLNEKRYFSPYSMMNYSSIDQNKINDLCLKNNTQNEKYLKPIPIENGKNTYSVSFFEYQNLICPVSIANKENFSLSQNDLSILNLMKFELHWKVLDRWIFHHHNFIIDPLQRISKGVPWSQVFSQYGAGVALFIGPIIKMIGEFSLPGYFSAYFFTFSLYLLMFYLFFYNFFPDKRDAFLVTSVLLIGFLGIGHEYLILGPGIHPFRHMFDFFLFALLFHHFKEKKQSYFFAGVVLSILSALTNGDLGLVLFISFWGSIFLTEIFSRNWRSLGFYFVSFCISIGLFYLFRHGVTHNHYSKYYLHGLVSFLLQKEIWIFCTLTLVSFTVVGFVVIGSKRTSSQKAVYSFSVFYLLGAMTYFYWSGLSDHLLILSSSWALLLASLFVNFSNKGNIGITKDVVTLTFTILVILMGLRYNYQKNRFLSNFDQYVVYQWDFKKVKIKSTLDPKYFEGIKKLVDRYEKNDSIYMISHYDHILPLVLDKYNGFPFPQMSWFMYTQEEEMEVENTLINKSPDYLFVDNEFEYSPFFDVIQMYAPIFQYLHNESVLRAQKYERMRLIWERVRKHYYLVEKGELISVYAKKEK